MFTNLFSIFDPNSSINLSLNWLAISISFLMFPKIYWLKQNKMNLVTKLILMFLFNEMTKLIQKKNHNNIFFFMMIFFLILIMNFMGLFPYIFTPSSHLTVSLPMSFSIWMGIILHNWINKTNFMFAHLVPIGTPTLLMPLMVIIETISNLIRPGTLAIRLSANMIAGHLLFSLLGSTGSNLNFYLIILLILIQILLFMLEMAVSTIQSYVFTMLSSLYSNEN
uniref:ATP synthase subunit a n=2 Tax=Rhynchium TaxID=522435 RepID=A0A6M9AU35_9HYME|nr:ATP synthase F0 subunit 6 [Rhynchium aff. brunneum YN]YP_009859769.1 ATP synthase F0 subunit 6 [Rhynchium aff. brunneum GX]QKK69328.1 ATP synthase F0 subunit 6 [Rhynchium aff. brunneum YN]QKK69341.1 ATP synthase F0 subunit 6 [Rhynchium aff. brunneum GX]